MLYISLPSAFPPAGCGVIFLPVLRAEGLTGKPGGGNTLWTEDKGRFPAWPGLQGLAAALYLCGKINRAGPVDGW